MRYLFIAIVSAALISCGGKGNDENVAASLDSAAVASNSVDMEMINAVLQQIPSPLEISVMLKESGMDYQEDLLNNTDNVSMYNTTFQKAVNLGIYGTDLGYTNIYERNQDGIEYITTIKSLADDLDIGQFFDLATIRELAVNSNNLDSLMLITTQNFNDINAYLQSQGRSNLSALFLIGGWLEAMNITSQIALQSENREELKQAIGDQQAVAERLALLLNMYETETSMDEMREMLQPLWEEFGKVEIVITEGEKSSEVVDGVLVITDNSESSVSMSDESLQEIARLVSEIRNKLTL